MCGIVGYIGPRQAAPLLIAGLEKLEYRGYDSAGLAVINNGAITITKARGRLKNVSDQTNGGRAIAGTIGIGHTRWATHGEPSDVNSHPHPSQSGRYAVVHNGIIENYQALKSKLEAKGFTFRSQTDSEVIAHLIEWVAEDDLIKTMIAVCRHLEGSYALGILDATEPDRFVAVRCASQLVVGLGHGEQFVASDIPALLPWTRDCYLLDDHEIADVRADRVDVYSMDYEKIDKTPFHVDWDVSAAEKGGYEHYMMKEMCEQPDKLRDTINAYVHGHTLDFGHVDLSATRLSTLRSIRIIACGTAYHVGVFGKHLIEAFARIPVDVDIASEYRYRDPIVDSSDLVIVISQSGETADTMEALKESKRRGARVLALLNVRGSSMAREADDVLYTYAGPEIAVASTKAFTCQAVVMALLALHIGRVRGTLSEADGRDILTEIKRLPELSERIISDKAAYQSAAARLFNQRDVYFIGRSVDHAMALEASLKLKEISYIHSEACPAGELKHGPLSLIEDNTLVIALATVSRLADKMKSNIAEVKTRGARVVLVATPEIAHQFDGLADERFVIPDTHGAAASILSVVPLQLFAYYVAVLNGRDVDKPRNLAKSVTVE